MKGIDADIPSLDNETLPPCEVRKSRTRTLLEQLGDLGSLPARLGRPTRPQR